MVISLQGNGVIGVSGFNGMAEECIIDHKVALPLNTNPWRFFFCFLFFTFHLSIIPSSPFPLFLCLLLVISCFSAKHFFLSNAKPLFYIGVTTLAQRFVCVEWFNEEGHFVF